MPREIRPSLFNLALAVKKGTLKLQEVRKGQRYHVEQLTKMSADELERIIKPRDTRRSSILLAAPARVRVVRA